MAPVLRSLSVVQHALVVLLTGICLGRALALDGSWLPLAAASAGFLIVYAVGFGRAPALGASPQVLAPRSVGWLAVITACWLGLVALSAEFVWIAFVLWLLAGALLPWAAAIPYALATLAVVTWAPWHSAGELQLAGVIGPSVGALFALAVSRGQVELVREAQRRQQLVESLVAAQAEAEGLHTELAASQREAGVLAERTRLSRDIHDTLAQGFSSILLLARSAAVTRGEREVRELVSRIETAAAANLDEARRVVGALAPGDLQAGLPASLARLADAYAAETGADVEFRVDGDLSGLPTPVEVALVRTAQGALANVRRHAQASRVVLSLSGDADGVRLDIVDDGVGFDPAVVAARAATPSAGGYGLPSTRARLRELGGGIDIESAPGEGTALSAYVPLGGRP